MKRDIKYALTLKEVLQSVLALSTLLAAAVIFCAPAHAQQCKAKLNVYEYKDEYGRLQQEICPENCADEADFPGYDPANPGTFSRVQGLGACRTYAMADYIGFQLRRINGWKVGHPLFKKGVSAWDLQVLAYAVQIKAPGKNTIKAFIGDPNESNPVMNDAGTLINIAQTIGVCPETAFPSNFDSTKGDGWRFYSAFQQRIRDWKSKAPWARGSLVNFCPECRAIAPQLTNAQWQEVEQNIDKTSNLDTDDFDVLMKINQIACPAEKRNKLPRRIVENGVVVDNFEMRDHNISELIERLSKPESIAFFQGHANPLNPENIPKTTCNERELKEDESRAPDEKKCGPDYHAMVVFGTIGRIINGKPTCLYAVKNSWGPKACVPRPPDIYCDEEKGTYYLSQTMLARILTSFKW